MDKLEVDIELNGSRLSFGNPPVLHLPFVILIYNVLEAYFSVSNEAIIVCDSVSREVIHKK